jgi:hypothetical protein
MWEDFMCAWWCHFRWFSTPRRVVPTGNTAGFPFLKFDLLFNVVVATDWIIRQDSCLLIHKVWTPVVRLLPNLIASPQIPTCWFNLINSVALPSDRRYLVFIPRPGWTRFGIDVLAPNIRHGSVVRNSLKCVILHHDDDTNLSCYLLSTALGGFSLWILYGIRRHFWYITLFRLLPCWMSRRHGAPFNRH